MSAAQTWLRNPILWLVIAIPLATLAGGYQTARLAYETGASDEVPDDVTRTGQAQVVELAPDRAAARDDLRISITLDLASRRITATQVAGAPLQSQPVVLRFVHPTRAGQDRVVQLLAADGSWQAPMPRLTDNDWQLVLNDPGVRWRLVGRLPRGAASASLRSSLPP